MTTTMIRITSYWAFFPLSFFFLIILSCAQQQSTAFLLSPAYTPTTATPTATPTPTCSRLRKQQTPHYQSLLVVKVRSCCFSSSSSSTTLSQLQTRTLCILQSSDSDSQFEFEDYTRAVAYESERIIARTTILNSHRPDLNLSLTDDNAIVIAKFRDAISLLTFGIGLVVGTMVVTILLLIQLLLQQQQQEHEHEQHQQEQELDSNSTSTTAAAAAAAATATTTNRSVTAGSRTAILALWARSQMNLIIGGGGGPDYLAPLFLDQVLSSSSSSLSLSSSSSFPSSYALQLRSNLIQICGWLSRINFKITHNIFEDQIAFILSLFNTGLLAPVQVRTCFLDDCVETFIRQQQQQQQQQKQQSDSNVVILGSGYDTRCYRLGLLKEENDKDEKKININNNNNNMNINLFEVDAPGTQQEKKRILRDTKVGGGTVNFCPCDFETEDWLECLVNHESSLDVTLPTIFVWEGVTMYLSESIVKDTLIKISQNFTSSDTVIGFDYINKEWAMSPIWRRIMNRVQEPFQFAMSTNTNSDDVDELIQSCGLVVLEHLNDTDEMARRYLPNKINDNSTRIRSSSSTTGVGVGLVGNNPTTIGIIGDYGGFVVAGVPSDSTSRHQ